MMVLLEVPEFVDCLIKQVRVNQKAHIGLMNMFRGHAANRTDSRVADALQSIITSLMFPYQQ